MKSFKLVTISEFYKQSVIVVEIWNSKVITNNNKKRLYYIYVGQSDMLDTFSKSKIIYDIRNDKLYYTVSEVGIDGYLLVEPVEGLFSKYLKSVIIHNN